MIQLTSDEETSSGEHGLWLRRWSKTILQSEMQQGTKLLLGLLSGPSRMISDLTSLKLAIMKSRFCLSKKLFQCASGCLCQETILPRV